MVLSPDYQKHHNTRKRKSDQYQRVRVDSAVTMKKPSLDLDVKEEQDHEVNNTAAEDELNVSEVLSYFLTAEYI